MTSVTSVTVQGILPAIAAPTLVAVAVEEVAAAVEEVAAVAEVMATVAEVLVAVEGVEAAAEEGVSITDQNPVSLHRCPANITQNCQHCNERPYFLGIFNVFQD